MEEVVGKLWHRWITRAAGGHHPDAAVRLKEIERTAGVMFRALGGDRGLRVAAATEDRHGARRTLLERIAGSGEKATAARFDATTLRLPPTIDAFPERGLNRDLYLWLAALAAAVAAERALAEASGTTATGAADDPDGLIRNQRATLAVLKTWPGLAARYRRLVAAYLDLRPVPKQLPPAEALRERAIRRALEAPGSVTTVPAVPPGTPPARPVLLWLAHDGESHSGRRSRDRADASSSAAPTRPEDDHRRNAHRAEEVEMPKDKNGVLLMFRAESLLAVSEFLRVNRSTDDDPDPHADEAARDLDHLSVAVDNERVASKVRFDLDLPAAAEDDVVLGPGLPLPEWDYRKGRLLDDHVRLTEYAPRHAPPSPLPAHLRRTARRLHHQFAALAPARRWVKSQPDGTELDVDAAVRAHTDRACGRHASDRVYLSLERRERDLACLALADLSLSTDAWVSGEARVIDVIRDALLLFGEALGATGDQFAMAGFSSVKRSQVRFHRLKDFGERFDNRIRGRVMAIKPGYYTRLGAAIRRSTQLLVKQPASRRILLILSDGKPNDLDLYDGRYGIEDTRMAVIEARRQGLTPFCVTIDREGAGYLAHLFGPAGFAVIREPSELPARLPLFYAQLTR